MGTFPEVSIPVIGRDELPWPPSIAFPPYEPPEMGNLPWGTFPPTLTGWPPTLTLPTPWTQFANEFMRLAYEVGRHRVAGGLASMYPPWDLRNYWMCDPEIAHLALSWLGRMWNTQPATPSGPAQSLLLETTDPAWLRADPPWTYLGWFAGTCSMTKTCAATDVSVWFRVDGQSGWTGNQVDIRFDFCSFRYDKHTGSGFENLSLSRYGGSVGVYEWGVDYTLQNTGWHKVRAYLEGGYAHFTFDDVEITSWECSYLESTYLVLESQGGAYEGSTHFDVFFSEATIDGVVDYFDSLADWSEWHYSKIGLGNNTITQSTAQIHSGGGSSTPITKIVVPSVFEIGSNMLSALYNWLTGAEATTYSHTRS
jgi:hypothetical protein